MGGRASKQKGNRFERQLVIQLQEAGFAATRIPMSGAAGGKFGSHDIDLPLLGRDRKVQSKHYANGAGFQMMYGWLEKADLLMLRSDRSETLVVLPWPLAIELFKVAERNRINQKEGNKNDR